MTETAVRMCRKKLHELTPDNLTADGRACRACRRRTQREWVAAERAAEREAEKLQPFAQVLIEAVARRDNQSVDNLLAAADRRAVNTIVVLLARQVATGRRELAGAAS
jgi:hypothetical protein